MCPKERDLKATLNKFMCTIPNIQGLPKVWKPLNNFCKNENIKKQ